MSNCTHKALCTENASSYSDYSIDHGFVIAKRATLDSPFLGWTTTDLFFDFVDKMVQEAFIAFCIPTVSASFDDSMRVNLTNFLDCLALFHPSLRDPVHVALAGWSYVFCGHHGGMSGSRVAIGNMSALLPGKLSRFVLTREIIHP